MTNVLAGASDLLAFIRKTETGETGEDAYRTIIGHRQGTLPKPVTAYTVDELIEAQVKWGRNWKSSAAGAYQIIRKTLVGLKKSLGLSGSEKFTPELQDRMAVELLRQRGWEKASSGRLSREAFALALAREWASLPVLRAMKGAKRQVKRGESYYAGDGLNKHQVTAEQFEAVLDRALGKSAPIPAPRPVDAPTAQQVIDIQERLRALGYHEVGAIDGIIGPATENAILIFRKDNGLPLSTRIDASLRDALLRAKPRQVADSRAEASPKEVREQAPEAKQTWQGKIAAFWGLIVAGVTATGQFVMDNVEAAREWVSPALNMLDVVPGWVWPTAIAGGLLFIYLKSRSAEKQTIAAYQTGERR